VRAGDPAAAEVVAQAMRQHDALNVQPTDGLPEPAPAPALRPGQQVSTVDGRLLGVVKEVSGGHFTLSRGPGEEDVRLPLGGPPE
jgi:hypothetical protein